ncbi:hypothetical protein LCGC14_1545060, partial [marine sediment metagenome]
STSATAPPPMTIKDIEKAMELLAADPPHPMEALAEEHGFDLLNGDMCFVPLGFCEKMCMLKHPQVFERPYLEAVYFAKPSAFGLDTIRKWRNA